LKGSEIDIVYGEGKVFARVLVPTSATIVSVGGPGSEYLVNGINYSFSNTQGTMPEAGKAMHSSQSNKSTLQASGE
jgi:hypothetical protein